MLSSSQFMQILITFEWNVIKLFCNNSVTVQNLHTINKNFRFTLHCFYRLIWLFNLTILMDNKIYFILILNLGDWVTSIFWIDGAQAAMAMSHLRLLVHSNKKKYHRNIENVWKFVNIKINMCCALNHSLWDCKIISKT